MRDLIVSAGKKRKLYDIPADAPARACCHSGRGRISVVGFVLEFHLRKRRVAVSLLPNQAAHPPVSRIRVPSCPFQNPRMPWCLNTSRMTDRGVGAMPEGTWILHFTSSTGVSTMLVNAPEMAPVSQSADNGRGVSRV